MNACDESSILGQMVERIITPAVMGIDPGLQGAIGFLALDRSHAEVHPLPVIDGEIDVMTLSGVVAEARSRLDVRFCLIEQAMVLPTQGSVSGFTIGKNYGRLLTFLEMAVLPFEEIRPSKWKKMMFGAVKYESKKEMKQAAVLHARKLFPQLASELKLTKDGLSEALLLAEVARGQIVGVER